jgi:hypothetical protein
MFDRQVTDWHKHSYTYTRCTFTSFFNFQSWRTFYSHQSNKFKWHYWLFSTSIVNICYQYNTNFLFFMQLYTKWQNLFTVKRKLNLPVLMYTYINEWDCYLCEYIFFPLYNSE